MNTAEHEIHTLTKTWLAACRALDMGGIMANYAEDIVSYDAVVGLRFVGLDAYREHWKMCVEHCPGPMVFNMPELSIVANDSLGICHSLLNCGAEDNGELKTSWMRATICWRKTDRWRVFHEHFSAPFDMDTGQALFDLTP